MEENLENRFWLDEFTAAFFQLDNFRIVMAYILSWNRQNPVITRIFQGSGYLYLYIEAHP